MSKAFNFQHGRMLILITVFILLTGMIVLIYSHPDKKRDNSVSKSTYEQNIRELWHEQIAQLISQNDWHNARLAAGKVLHSIPDDLLAKRFLVRIAAEEKKFAQALKMSRDILFYHPEDAGSRNNLAVLLMPSAPEEAAREITLALQLQPDNPVIRRNFEIISRISTRKKPEGIPPESFNHPDLLSMKLPEPRS